MTSTPAAPTTGERWGTSDRRTAVAVLVAGALPALVTVSLSPLVGSVTVTDDAAQRDVAFGMPVAWVHQDQTSLDPPFPDRARFVSPWEHPTTASAGAFAVDVAGVGAVLTVAGVLLVAAGRASRRTAHQGGAG